MGQVLLAGTGQVPARQAATRPDPHDHARDSGQQGVPFRAQRHLPGRPDDRGRRRRHRGGRRDGVDDRRPPPAARRPPGLSPRRHRAARRPLLRRAGGCPHPRGHGSRQRALPAAVPGGDPRPPGRLRGGVSRTGGPGDQGWPPRGRDHPVEVPQRKGDPVIVDDRRGNPTWHHAEGAGKLRPAFSPRRFDHRRQRVADLRRRVGPRGHVRAGGERHGVEPLVG